MNKEQMSVLVTHYYQIQKHRIRMSNQIMDFKKREVPHGELKKHYENMHLIEKQIAKDLKHAVKEFDVFTCFICQVKGIGPVLGAAICSMLDIEVANHASSFYKYCGLDVVLSVDEKTGETIGKAPRRTVGKKLTYNPFCKTICWKIGASFIKCNSPYKQFYNEKKEFYQNKYPKRTKLHIHNMAWRYMVKQFLSDLWVAWRELRELPVTDPYPIGKLGHKSHREPLYSLNYNT